MESSETSDNISLTSQHVIVRRSEPLQVWQGRLTRYERVRELGAGGQADVFLARDEDWMEVAIKVPKANPTARDRFGRELRELQRSRHPHVMPVYDQGEDWYAMPVAEGALVALAAPLSDDERIEVVDHVAGSPGRSGVLRCGSILARPADDVESLQVGAPSSS